MADRRRRRRREDGGEDEGGAADTLKEGSTKTRASECESEGEGNGGDVLSENGSASEKKVKEDEEDSEEESDSSEETDSDSDDDDDDEEEDDDEEAYDDDVIIEDDGSWVEEERQSGDGEEQQEDGKNLDDDEDRKNPAYIPRKGAFYEHDTRMHGGGETQQKEEEDDQRPKKKLWKDEEKWLHDRYRDDQQAPKSREELIAIYGYDIRAYDKPPDSAPKRGMGKRGGRRGQRRLGDFVPSQRMKTELDNRTSYSDLANENDMRSPREYRTEIRTGPDYRNQDNRSQYETRAKNYHNQSQDYRNQAPDGRSQDYRLEHRSQDYRNQDYGSRSSQDYRVSPEKSQDYRNQADSRSGYRGHSDYNNQYQSDYVQRNNMDNSRGRGRGRGGRGRGNRGRYSDSPETSFAPSRPRQSTSPREFTNTTLKNPGQDADQDPQVERESDSSEIKEKSQSQDVIISNKENVQTISVTITNTTTEKKSYSKDRRSKVVGRTRVQDTVVNAIDPNVGSMAIESPAKAPPEENNGRAAAQQSGSSKIADKQQFPPRLQNTAAKPDMAQQSRPKRYSSQRQRNIPDVNYSDQVSVDSGTYYNPAAPAYTPPMYRPEQSVAQPPQPSPPRLPQPQPQDTAGFQTTILQPPMGFPLPVSTAGLPNVPPRLYAPGPAPAVTMTAPSAIIQPQFLGTGVPGVPQVVYGAPPGPYPMTVGFPSPPPPPPQQGAAAPAPPSNTGQELFRGGTTYYAPELQQPSPNRSPQKRPKAAIPIVNPIEHKKNGRTAYEREESSRAGHPVVGAEMDREGETNLSPVPDSSDGDGDPGLTAYSQQAELPPYESATYKASQEHSASNNQQSDSFVQSTDINISDANSEPDQNMISSDHLSKTTEDSPRIMFSHPTDTDASEVSQHLVETKSEPRIPEDKLTAIAHSQDHILESSSSVSKSVPNVAVEITRDLEHVSLNETDTSNPAQSTDVKDDERRKPQVQEFCVRKDFEVADIKPSVSQIDSAVDAGGDSSQYGGSKMQMKIEMEEGSSEADVSVPATAVEASN
ncbi:protein CASC3-like [Haliotis rubra]|uniref:protein CASC3-like n=1 Tax=Haliotis rubra TaxID=36100 RepID=UPI001EE5ED60|nr:protein CASC3-like [Haliotis rubra]